MASREPITFLKIGGTLALYRVLLAILMGCGGSTLRPTTVNPIKWETGLRPNSAGISYTLLLRIGAIGFPTFWASSVMLLSLP